MGFRTDHETCLLGVWVYVICLLLIPSRIADFQDVLKEPTIALEKLRELSFSGKRQLHFQGFPRAALRLGERGRYQGHTSWGLLQFLWT